MSFDRNLSRALALEPKLDHWEKQYQQLDHNPHAQSDRFEIWKSNVGQMPEKEYTEPLSPLRKQAFGQLSPGEERLADSKALANVAFAGDKMVARAQASLVIAGYPLGNDKRLGIDGINGPKTTEALLWFQDAVGLEPTGRVDLETMIALDLVTEKGLTIREIESLGKQTMREVDPLHQPSQRVRMYSDLNPEEKQRIQERNGLIKPGQYKDYYIAKSQASLGKAGYDLGPDGIDGINGHYTTKAVKEFQTDYGLKPTGILDSDTMLALEKATAEGWKRPQRTQRIENSLKPDQSLNHTKQYNVYYNSEIASKRAVDLRLAFYDDIAKCQYKLKAMGFGIGLYGVHGIIDDNTRTAIMDFQKTFDLSETGKLDQKTVQKINEEYEKGAYVFKASEMKNSNVEDMSKNSGFANSQHNLRSTQQHLPVQPPITNRVGERSPERYNQVLDQFDVENNPRYMKQENRTYCNIFVWDVTRAMNAEIPHWVNAKGEPCKPGEPGSRELNANLTAKWLKEHGEKYGWKEATREEAIAAANAGKPAVAVWYNNDYKNGTYDVKHPWSHDWGQSGHIVMVRPQNPSLLKDNKAKSRYDVYIAQAGSTNYQYTKIENGFGEAKMRQTKEPHDYFKYYVHE